MSLLVGVFHSVVHTLNSTGRVHWSEVNKLLLGIKIQFIKMRMKLGLMWGNLIRVMQDAPSTEQIPL